MQDAFEALLRCQDDHSATNIEQLRDAIKLCAQYRQGFNDVASQLDKISGPPSPKNQLM